MISVCCERGSIGENAQKTNVKPSVYCIHLESPHKSLAINSTGVIIGWVSNKVLGR